MTGRLASDQAFRDGAHRLGVGTDARHGGGPVGERLGHLFVIDVVRDLDQDRAAAAALEAREGAPEDVRDLRARGDRLGRLGDVAHVEDGVEVRRDVGEAAGIALGQDQDRHRLAIGLGDAAEGVLGAGAVLHREHADLLAAGEARHGVRHVQTDPLLADDDRPDAGARGELEHVVDRIAEDDLDAFAPQDLGDRLARLHGPPPAFSRHHGNGCGRRCPEPSRCRALNSGHLPTPDRSRFTGSRAGKGQEKESLFQEPLSKGRDQAVASTRSSRRSIRSSRALMASISPPWRARSPCMVAR